jgi:chemotaxis protein methyltransferase CheR
MMQSVSAKQILSQNDYKKFQTFLEDACGIVLGEGKEYLVSSRLSRLIRENQLNTVGELLEQLGNGRNTRLRTSVIDAMTTNETFWFRDIAHYRMLTENILPGFKGSAGRRFRVWSAACSSGQEPYNISMVLEDFKKKNPGTLSAGIEVMATDISSSILADARKGCYCGRMATRGLNDEQLRRYFVRSGDCIEVRPELKRNVSFRELNLTKGYELLGKFDIIFCRNVLIYFSSYNKQDILGRLANTLNPGGYLFLGSTESLSGLTDRFEMVSKNGAISYRLR